MKGWASGLLVGLVVAIVATTVAWKSGAISFAAPKPKPVVHTLPSGTDVSFLLLQPLSSGGAKEGEKVPILVEKDVLTPDGQIAIKAGSAGLAEVVESRGATALTTLVNQPARLAIKFLTVRGVSGDIDLQPSPEPGETAYSLTRTNTGGQDLSDLAEKVGSNKELRDSWKSALDQIQTKGPVDLKAPDLRKVLQGIASDMEMPSTEKSLKDDKAWSSLSDVADRAKRGDLTGLAAGDVMLAISALNEISNLAGSMDRTLRGIFKGRNIEAPLGMRLSAKTSEAYQFEVLPQ